MGLRRRSPGRGPARIAEDINIWRPEVEPLEEHVGAVLANRLNVLNAALRTDDFSHSVNGGRVESRGQSTGSGNSVVPLLMTPCSDSLHQS